MGVRLRIDHQQFQQLVSFSSRLVESVRSILAHKAIEIIDPVAWVVDDTGFVKDEWASLGVVRHYSDTRRSGNWP